MQTIKRTCHTRSAVLLIVAVCIAASGCIFDDEKSKTSVDEFGWTIIQMPDEISGKWYRENVLALDIDEGIVYIDNRPWQAVEAAKKDDRYRLIVQSYNQYMAIYFRNVTEHSAERSFSDIAYNQYHAKEVGYGGWTVLSRTPE